MQAMRYGSAGLLALAIACALGAAPSQARGPQVRISGPATLLAGKPCRITVTVGRDLRGTILLQRRSSGRWRTVSSARVRRRSTTLRCPTVARTGPARVFRALVRRGGRTIARSPTVRIPIAAAPATTPSVTTPAPAPPAARSCSASAAPAPPPPPLDPAQFGVEGTGGPPSAEALALLGNQNVVLDADGVADINEGRIDPRIIAVLTKLSEAHKITVSALCRDHAQFTTGGAISNHYLGRGMDIGAIDGVPVSPSNATAREVAGGLSSLDPSYRPDEIGTPWVIAGPGYFTDADHQDLIHVAFKQAIDPLWRPPA